MEVIAVFDVLRRRIYLIGALCIVTALAGYGISFVAALVPEKYDASATVLVRPHTPSKIEPNGGGKEFLDFPVAQTPIVETAAKTYIQIIQSSALVGEVVRELRLDEKLPEKEIDNGTIFGKIYAPLRDFYDDLELYVKDAVSFIKYGRVLRVDPFTKAVTDVSKGLVLKSYEDTYVFEIKFSGEDPQTAAAVANTTARLFIEFMSKMRSDEAKDAADRLRNELEQSRQRLVDAREQLRAYKSAHNTFLYRPEYEAKLKVISDLTVELAKLDETLAGAFEAKTYALKRARLVQTLDETRADLASLPMIERELQLREADADVASTTYGIVARELKDAEIKSDVVPEARLISPASEPKLPSSPRRGIILGVSLFSGLLVGVALALFLEYINRKARGISDIEAVVGVKIIGTIPLAPRSALVGHKRGSSQRSSHVPHSAAAARSATNASN
jgi:uncharacterized protein involved in exopolysaccharide biosynthesis